MIPTLRSSTPQMIDVLTKVDKLLTPETWIKSNQPNYYTADGKGVITTYWDTKSTRWTMSDAVGKVCQEIIPNDHFASLGLYCDTMVVLSHEVSDNGNWKINDSLDAGKSHVHFFSPAAFNDHPDITMEHVHELLHGAIDSLVRSIS